MCSPLLPHSQRAIVAINDGTLAISTNAGVATLKPDMILVKTAAVSINPIDTKLNGPYSTPGAIAGCDFSGIVIAVGCAVKRNIQVGDRVCGAAFGMNPQDATSGAFATYVGVPGDLTLTLPQAMKLEEGAALGTTFATAGLALFHSLAIPARPSQAAEKSFPVLIYGGSTASGTAAIQLLKLAGLEPIAICSPRNFDLVKSRGASAAFDYRSPTCAADIKRLTRNALAFALDCITTVESMTICYEALGRGGGRYTALDPFPEAIAKKRAVITPKWVVGLTMIGIDITWPAPHNSKGCPELRVWGEEWFRTLQNLLDEGKIVTHPLEFGKGGFDGVLRGMDRLRAKEVTGQKLVYSLQED